MEYTWAIISKPAGSSATLSNIAVSNPTFATDILGSYVLGLMVSDGLVTNSDTMVVTVRERYLRNDTTEIVTDYNRGLEWQDDINASSIIKSHGEAIAHCSSLTLDGGDWRLPELVE